ncbi:hypothetical protein [Bradyrhizobium japonicum]|uniref:hypothetical protein n=1 Tax=Bradyrhizobium japonicum TaxID=375 RepID=UPI001BA5C2EA|nr:hypothetical protein [Bradyrhizobium japonicum]MBR0913948.1 hypothetical protein [Bradyrhizobium japonicum]
MTRRFGQFRWASWLVVACSLLVLLSAAFAGKFAPITRFASDPTLAPRDFAIYKEDVNRIAGATFLVASIVGRDQVYDDPTVRTIGGVIYQETASPDGKLAGKKISLNYNPKLPDGSRLEIRIDDQTYKSELYDWALIPISNFANSPSTALLSLLGKAESDDERDFQRGQRRNGAKTFWVRIHPDLKDTLVGFNALLTDSMLLLGDPSSTRQYPEGLTPKVPGWNTSELDKTVSLAASQTFSSLLIQASWNSYIFNDLNAEYVFSTAGDRFVIKGKPPTYHFFSLPFGERARPEPELNDQFQRTANALGADGGGLRGLSPAVYDTSYKTSQWAAFFRYVKSKQPAAWSAYLASLDQATNVLAIETPVAWVRK